MKEEIVNDMYQRFDLPNIELDKFKLFEEVNELRYRSKEGYCLIYDFKLKQLYYKYNHSNCNFPDRMSMENMMSVK